MSETKGKTSLGMEQNLEGLLCYVIGDNRDNIPATGKGQQIRTFPCRPVNSNIWCFYCSYNNLQVYTVWGIHNHPPRHIILYIVDSTDGEAYQGKMYKLPAAGNIAEKYSKPSTDNQPEEKK